MAKIRVEWVRLAREDAADHPAMLLGPAVVQTVGPGAVSLAAPNFSAADPGRQASAFAKVRVLSGAVNLAWGNAPTASETGGYRIEGGGSAMVPITAGQSISMIEAADPPAAAPTSAIRAIAAARSGAITAGGAAQDLMAANPARAGWLIQNQSSANLYIRSKGAAGTQAASASGDSLIVPPGGYYEPPKISPHALSVFGPAAGQAFFAEEW